MREVVLSGVRRSLRLASVPAILAVLLPPLLFPEVLFFGQSFYFWDLGWFHFPLRVLVADLLRTGALPLWNPYSWNGFPLLAESAASALSPVNFPFLLPLPPYAAFNFEILLQVSIAGGSAYALARQVGVSPGSALLAALSYGAGGFIMTQLICLEMLIGSAWAPLICALLLSAIQRKRMSHALLGGFALALQILSTHPQAAFYTAVLLGALALYGMWAEWRQPVPFDWRKVFRPLAYLSVIMLVGIGLSAPQILTGFELLSLSRRAEGLDPAAQSILSLPPNSFLTLIFPRLFLAPASSWRTTGIYDEFHFYLGLIPLVCAVGALRKRNETIVSFAFVVVGLTVLLALGHFTPFYELITTIPPFGFFRGPGRWLFITSIVCVVLVGKGADALYELMRETNGRAALMRIGRDLTILYFAITLSVPVALLIRPPDAQILAVEDAYSAERLATRAQSVARLLPESVGFTLTAGAALASFWVLAVRRRSPRAFAVVALALTFADLFFAGGELTISPSHWDEARPLAEFIQSNTRYDRVFSAGSSGAEVARLSEANPSRMHVFASSGEDMSQGLQRNEDYLSSLPFVTALRMSSTRWVAVPDPLPTRLSRFGALAAPALSELHQTATLTDVALYAVPDPLPRAYVVYDAIHVASPQEALQRLSAPDFDPAAMAVVEDVPIDPSLPTEPGKSYTPARLTAAGPDFVDVYAQTERDGLLVLTDTDYPGWRVWVDGMERSLVRANYLFRGVHLSAGQHTIQFRFEPISFALGLAISIGTLCVVLLGVVYVRHRAGRGRARA